MDLTRRTFLATTGLVGAAPLSRSAPRLPDPFELGVASGEPAPDGVVLWTRLAPKPLASDGHGGMPARDVEVEWQIADDPYFRRVVRQGRSAGRHACAHSVHVEVGGLAPGREYFYGFRATGHLSPRGEMRAEFHSVPYVTRRGAPASITANFTVGDGARSLGDPSR